MLVARHRQRWKRDERIELRIEVIQHHVERRVRQCPLQAGYRQVHPTDRQDFRPQPAHPARRDRVADGPVEVPGATSSCGEQSRPSTAGNTSQATMGSLRRRNSANRSGVRARLMTIAFIAEGQAWRDVRLRAERVEVWSLNRKRAAGNVVALAAGSGAFIAVRPRRGTTAAAPTVDIPPPSSFVVKDHDTARPSVGTDFSMRRAPSPGGDPAMKQLLSFAAALALAVALPAERADQMGHADRVSGEQFPHREHPAVRRRRRPRDRRQAQDHRALRTPRCSRRPRSSAPCRAGRRSWARSCSSTSRTRTRSTASTACRSSRRRTPSR